MRQSHRSDPSRRPAPDPASGTNLKRRGFLLAVGAGGVGAAAIAAQSIPGTAALDASAATATTASKGYAVTEHVQRYYRTMKV